MKPPNKTWGFWNTESHPFESCVSHSWTGWKTLRGSSESISRSRNYKYCRIPADVFYEHCLSRLDSIESVTIRTQVEVDAVHDAGTCALVRTNAGEFRAPYVFDSRPLQSREVSPQASSPSAFRPQPLILRQQFLGWTINVPAQTFDTNQISLMDFVDFNQSVPSFMYALPLSENEIFVEATVFAKELVPDSFFLHMFARYLRKRAIQCSHVVQTEYGSIPMAVVENRPNPGRVIDIGVRAGMARASTGYAFLNIQRDSARIASSLASGGGVPPRRDTVLTFLDRLFLQCIDAYPERFAEIVHKLFRDVDSDAMVRFMSDCPGLVDLTAIVNAMPNKLEMLQILTQAERTANVKLA